MLKGLKNTVLLAALLIAMPSLASPADPFVTTPAQPPEWQLASGAMTLQQAAAQARQQGGKVVKAETRSSGGKTVHQIRIVKEGRVRTMVYDAATGKQLQ